MGSGKKEPSRSKDRSFVFKNAVHISQHRPLAIFFFASTIFWLYSVDSDVLLVFHWLTSPGWCVFISPLPFLEMDFFSIIRVGVIILLTCCVI